MNALLSALLKRALLTGNLTVVDASGEAHQFGDGTGPPLAITLHDRKVERAILTNPELVLGEAYMDGRWSVREGTLTEIIAMFMMNTRDDAPWQWQRGIRKLVRAWRQRNDTKRARKNARHHYDVGNEIYELFLDNDWQYSCAYFSQPSMTLEEAQLAKKRHIAAKLALEPGMRVLDIGCGWGGMALYLAEQVGVDVTGITLAENQAKRARDRAVGRQDVRFRVEDYRETPEVYDRIVSVGMFEHVGVNHFDAFFQNVRRLLADDGVMLLHFISRTGTPGSTNPFIAKYIFPGGYTPSLSEVLPAIERSGLTVTDLEIWRIHYATTLKHWRERLLANRTRVVELMDEPFVRMWEFYLAGCEAAFRVGDVAVSQVQIAKSVDALPLTRDYMVTAERQLAARDSRGRRPALVARHG